MLNIENVCVNFCHLIFRKKSCNSLILNKYINLIEISTLISWFYWQIFRSCYSEWWEEVVNFLFFSILLFSFLSFLFFITLQHSSWFFQFLKHFLSVWCFCVDDSEESVCVLFFLWSVFFSSQFYQDYLDFFLIDWCIERFFLWLSQFFLVFYVIRASDFSVFTISDFLLFF